MNLKSIIIATLSLTTTSLFALTATIDNGNIGYSDLEGAKIKIVFQGVKIEKGASAWAKIGAILYKLKKSKAFEYNTEKGWFTTSLPSNPKVNKAIFWDKANNSAGVVIGTDSTIPSDIDFEKSVDVYIDDKEIGYIAAFDPKGTQLSASEAFNVITRAVQ